MLPLHIEYVSLVLFQLTFKFKANVVHVDPVSEHGSFVITGDGRLSFITLDKKQRWLVVKFLTVCSN